MTPEEARIRKLEERQKDMIHVADLRDLIAEWRNEYAEYDNDPSKVVNGGHQMKCMALNECADDLEALLADVEGERDE